MAITNANIPSATSDLVAIINADTFEQEFITARPLKVSSNSSIQYMQNPIETGGVITDHKIDLPDVVSIACIVTGFNYRDLASQVSSLAKASTQFTVQTKSMTYTNMVIEEFPIEEEPEKFDSITITLNFREIQFDSAQIQTLTPASVTNPADASTVDRGEQSGSDSEGSLASQAARAIGVIN